MGYTFTVHIAHPKTPLVGGGRSSAGHIWYSLGDGINKDQHFGFAPEVDGTPFGPGTIKRGDTGDDKTYTSTAFTWTMDITKEQYDRLLDYGKDPEKYGFNKTYNVLSNSCVDHIWKAVDVGGFKMTGDNYPRQGYEGRLYPHNNTGPLRDLINPELAGRRGLASDERFECVDNWCKLNRSGQSHTVDPLALDLDGDGLETVSHNRFSGSLFDHSGEGIRTATGWLKGDDGFLVYDRNGNGVIDDGTELFGDSTILADGSRAAHGYAALSEWDANSDGKVDAADIGFASLRVWRDLNQDGISQTGELFTLADVGVLSLSLQYTTPNQNLGNGNFLAQSGRYIRTDGSTALVRDLRQAAALSGSLADVLAAYSGAANDKVWDWGFQAA